MQTFVGSLSARYEKVSGIVNISRMAGHAAQQHMPVECLRIDQLVNSMRSSIQGQPAPGTDIHLLSDEHANL